MSKLVTRSDGVRTVAGRRLLLTPELRDRMCELIKDLRYLSLTAEAVGINVKTAERWMKVGETHEKNNHPEGDDCTANCAEDMAAYRSFFTSIKRAKAEATLEGLQTIKSHGVTNWQAAAWIEERTNQELFGAKGRVEHTGKDGGPIIHKVLSVEQKKRMLEAGQQALKMEQNADGVFEPVDD